MIFTGDIVFPNRFNNKILNYLDSDFLNEQKIVNLESLVNISGDNIEKFRTTKGIALYSSSEVIKFLKELNIVGGSLANNHITDFDLSLNKQIDFYAKDGIQAFGGGDDIAKASQPFINNDFIILSYGWKVIGCKYASDVSKGVNPLEYNHIFKQVITYRKKFPSKKLVVLFHWNYEFELFPQPAHRKLSFDLIEEGVDAIFGHHSHIVQGFEIYKNKPIFYGLGNFYFPEQNYSGYNLKYPENARIGLAAKYDPKLEKISCFWLKKDYKNNLTIIKKEKAFVSLKLKELTPFAGLSHQDYVNWFKVNRAQKKLLPIYSNYRSNFNSFFDYFVLFRNNFINFLVNNGLK